jgi:hypothetical protein
MRKAIPKLKITIIVAIQPNPTVSSIQKIAIPIVL